MCLIFGIKKGKAFKCLTFFNKRVLTSLSSLDNSSDHSLAQLEHPLRLKGQLPLFQRKLLKELECLEEKQRLKKSWLLVNSAINTTKTSFLVSLYLHLVRSIKSRLVIIRFVQEKFRENEYFPSCCIA